MAIDLKNVNISLNEFQRDVHVLQVDCHVLSPLLKLLLTCLHSARRKVTLRFRFLALHCNCVLYNIAIGCSE